MPRLTAPSDYSKEPPRHPCLKINSKASLIEPFNVEPPRSALTCSYVTPSNFFYKRNHGPIPIVEDIEWNWLLTWLFWWQDIAQVMSLPLYREWKEQGKALVLKKNVFKY
ncbi:Sulfite oxidase [Arachis hypogaea]|nr:Sulfite oxidase [Arachis hypogaea]